MCDLSGHTTEYYNGTWSRSELYAGGMRLATYIGGETAFVYSDWLGNHRTYADQTGAAFEPCTNLPFGDGMSCNSPQWDTELFTGDEHDAASNTEHTDFRQLATTQGRWLTPDPMAGAVSNPQSWNKYNYGWNDPINKVDRNGKWPTDVHRWILEQAFPGMTGHDLAILINSSNNVDRLSNQGPNGAYQHAMCSPGQDPTACSEEINNFIMGNIALASINGKNDAGLWDLGQAIHTGTDCDSPWHCDDNGTPKCWLCNGAVTDWHIVGEYLLSNRLFMSRIMHSIDVARGFYEASFDGDTSPWSTTAIITSIDRDLGPNASEYDRSSEYQCRLGNIAGCADGFEGAWNAAIAQGGGGGGTPWYYLPTMVGFWHGIK